MSADAIPEKPSRSSFKEDVWAGIRSGVPVAVASAPFAVLFGALAVKNGFTVTEATVMSMTIYGGASQMVGIELFGQQMAPWLVVLSIFAVNFRHVLYSASVGRKLSHWTGLQQAVAYFLMTDPQFADTERRAEGGRKVSFVWYMAMGLTIYIPWVIESGLGAVFGNLIPDPHAIGMDFLLPIYFLGLVMSFRSRANWLPVVAVSGVASILAVNFVGSPWHVSIGAAAGIALATVLPARKEKLAP